MTLADYQNRWLDLVAIGHEETATTRAESARLHRLAEAGGTQRRRWQAEADQVDGFVADAMHVLAIGFVRPPSRCLPPSTSATPETNGSA